MKFKDTDVGLIQSNANLEVFKLKMERLLSMGVSQSDFPYYAGGDVMVNLTEHYTNYWNGKEFERRVCVYAEDTVPLLDEKLFSFGRQCNRNFTGRNTFLNPRNFEIENDFNILLTELTKDDDIVQTVNQFRLKRFFTGRHHSVLELVVVVLLTDRRKTKASLGGMRCADI